MAISRMQQPRQMYGLGSFVKKAVRKVTKPFTKVAKKIVPKEVAGIMRTAAPFLPPGYREAAYLLGTAKQTGRISPVDLALAAAPTFFSKTDMGRGIAQRVGDFKVPGMERNLRQVMVGTPKITARGDLQAIIPGDAVAGIGDTGIATQRIGTLPGFGEARTVSEATSGLFGKGGKMFQIGSGGPGILDTKAGQFLLGGDEGKFSKAKLAGVGLTTLSLIQNSKTPDEAGKALAASTGNSDDYERGYQLFSQLTPELFEVPEQFRMNVKDGGIMRTNYATGSEDPKPVNPFGPKPTGPVLPEEDKPFRPKPLKPIKMAGMDRKMAAQMLADELAEEEFGMDFYDLDIRTQMRIYQIALDMIDEGGGNAMGGLPNDRTNFALGTKPTAEESGLGGLPIEADMRYTGGFMPYGAKEKADDVPARLSKNEFVFTADAVRAAGGGSVNQGAKKMYQAMKQLEAKPEAKGMTA